MAKSFGCTTMMDRSLTHVLERGIGLVSTLSRVGIVFIGLQARPLVSSEMSTLLWLHGSRGSNWMYLPPKLSKANCCHRPIHQCCRLCSHPYQHRGHHHHCRPYHPHLLVLSLSNWRPYLSLNPCLSLHALIPLAFESHRLGSRTFSQELEFPPLARLTRRFLVV